MNNTKCLDETTVAKIQCPSCRDVLEREVHEKEKTEKISKRMKKGYCCLSFHCGHAWLDLLKRRVLLVRKSRKRLHFFRVCPIIGCSIAMSQDNRTAQDRHFAKHTRELALLLKPKKDRSHKRKERIVTKDDEDEEDSSSIVIEEEQS
eukprot:scaffold912_cov187-Ochromonas_danica.AAC.15